MRYAYKKKIYIFVFTVVDAVGSILFKAVRAFSGKRSERQEVPGRILLIRIDHIGDIINSTVVLEPIRKAFPDAAIDFLAPSWAAEILENNRHLDNVIRFDPPWFDRRVSGFSGQFKGIFSLTDIIRKGDYDLCVDLRGDFRHILAMSLAGVKRRVGYGITGGGFMLTDEVPYEENAHETGKNTRLLKTVGVEADASRVDLEFRDSDREAAGRLVSRESIEGKYAVIHTTPGHNMKEWDRGKFNDIMRYISEEKCFMPVKVGGVADPMDPGSKDVRIVDIAGKTTLGVLYNVIKGASLFVGVDSAPAHMAAAAGVPTIILFSGINDPGRWAPSGTNVKVLYPGAGRDLLGIKVEDVRRMIDEMVDEEGRTAR